MAALFFIPSLTSSQEGHTHTHEHKVALGTPSSLNCRERIEFKHCFRDRWSESVQATVYLTSETEEYNMGTVKDTAAVEVWMEADTVL